MLSQVTLRKNDAKIIGSPFNLLPDSLSVHNLLSRLVLIHRMFIKSDWIQCYLSGN